MSNLFEITADMMQLVDMMDDPEIDEQALIDTLEGAEGEFNAKIESWLKVIRMKEADIKERKDLIASLTDKNKMDDNAIERMKKVVMMVMNATGYKKAGTAILSATICGAGGKPPLVWADGIKEDPLLLPKEYVLGVTTYKPDTDKIREALDAGIEVPGVEYGERGSYLRIK